MEDYSCNIVEFWPDTVIDLIFQHLSGKEILDATLVHRLWNEFLSNSSVAWRKICIQPKSDPNLQCLVDSTRKYQHVKAVNASSINSQFVKILTRPERKFKSIVIYRMSFESRSQLKEILELSSKSLETLNLNTITATKRDEVEFSAHFPKLKDLRISYHFLDDGFPWINKMFKSAPSLESLHLGNACDQRMKEIIMTSVNLKKLSLAGRFQDINFFKDLSLQLPSRIQEFQFNDILSSSNDDENLRFFNNFFMSQSQTLRKFETDALLELEEFETAFRMQNLETLTIKSFHYNRDLIDVFLENSRQNQVKEASLKYLNVQIMDQKLIELLAIYATKLEELRADELNVNDASNPRWFPKLQKVQVFFLNQELEEKIRIKPENERTQLENLIISGIVSIDISVHLSQEQIAREILDAIEG